MPDILHCVTLIVGMSKPEGIYLSADCRVTNAATGKVIDETAVKSLTVHYPPMGGGPRALLGFAGLAILPDGTPMLDWIQQTIRGEQQEFINESMQHLLVRLNRDIARLQIALIITVVVIDPDNRRHAGGFTNVRRITPIQTGVMHRFEHIMQPLNDWAIFANGSGTHPMVTDGHFARLQPHLGVVPREPMNHMNLLAHVNRQAGICHRR